MRSCSLHSVFMGGGLPVLDLRIELVSAAVQNSYDSVNRKIRWSETRGFRFANFISIVPGETVRVVVPYNADRPDQWSVIDWTGTDPSTIPDRVEWSNGYNNEWSPSLPSSPSSDYPLLGRSVQRRVLVYGRVSQLNHYGRPICAVGSTVQVSYSDLTQPTLVSAVVYNSPDLVSTPSSFPASAFPPGMGDVMEPRRRSV